MMTTKQVAAELSIQPRSVKQLCQRGILKADKIGRDWLISQEELDHYKTIRRQPGRPAAAQPPRGAGEG